MVYFSYSLLCLQTFKNIEIQISNEMNLRHIWTKHESVCIYFDKPHFHSTIS